MYDPERFQDQGRETPSWELSGRDRLQEWFSQRKVEGEEAPSPRQRRDKTNRHAWEQLHAQRQAQLDARRSARAAWDRREQAQAAAEEASQPQEQPARDPRGDRYTYSLVHRGKKPRGAVAGIALVVAVAFVISLVAQNGLSEWGESLTEDYNEGYPTEPAPEPDTGEWDGDFSWPDILPEEESQEETEETELDRAELTGELTLDIQSSRDLEPLSYQELYAKCLPYTVSITVIASDGIGTGTGIVMTEDGYILTCNHVIEGGTTCRVTTSEDETYEALLVGGDAQTDLAVLKIEAEGLTPAEFGDSDQLTVGDEALAIGDPLGTELRGTLTNGIISAINRNVTVNGYSMTLIQTTAALNSGNSGGPLLNIYGQVVGVNNMKMNSSQVTVEGLGFAVPTRVVQEIVPLLSTQGKVSRPVLGITCYGIDEEMKELNGEPVTGLRVASVNESSDAYLQGLEVGDYITAVNGTHVVSVDEVKVLIEDLEIGDTVELEIYRLEPETETEETFTMEIALVDQSEIS